LARGARLTEMLKQPQYKPMAVEEEVIDIFAGVKGFLDKVPLNKVKEFEEKAFASLKANHPEYFEDVRVNQKISEELETKLMKFYEKFASDFISTLEKAA
jgi:F-type H+-transporting ATPase subunit alpha